MVQNTSETSVHLSLPGKDSFQERGVLKQPLELTLLILLPKDHLTSSYFAPPHERSNLVRLSVYPSSINVPSKVSFGRTLLSLVAERTCKPEIQPDRIQFARLLLERGADVNVPVEANSTPLHLASFYGRVDTTRVLLDLGAAANSTSKQGRTPLHSVAEGKYLKSQDDGGRVAQLLLARGADVNAPDEDNKTPLHLASFYRKVEVVRALLDSDAAANSKDSQGRTPLHVVAEGYYTDDDVIAHLLLNGGADVDAPDGDNKTPLHLASFFGTVKMVLILLNAGANASAKDSLGQTPLHLASQRPFSSQGDDVGIAQLLLEHNADANARDKANATPSDFASYYGRAKIASLLLDYGGKANANIKQRLTLRQLRSKYVQFDAESRVRVLEHWERVRRLPPTTVYLPHRFIAEF